MNRIERIEDWVTACAIWLAILTVIATIVTLLGISYAVVVIPLAIYDFIRRKLRRS